MMNYLNTLFILFFLLPIVTFGQTPDTEVVKEKTEFVDQVIEDKEIPASNSNTLMRPPPPPPPASNQIYKVVEEMPTFPGCEEMVDKKDRLQCAKRKMLEYLCLLYTSPSPRDATLSRMPSSA